MLEHIVNTTSMFKPQIDRKLYETAGETVDHYEEPLILDLDRLINGM